VGKHNAREGAYDADGRPTAGKWADILTHPELRGRNEIHGTGVELLENRRNRIAAADLERKPQRNAAAAIEVNISASPEWFEDNPRPEVQRMYFALARQWLEREFGKDQVLGWAVHYDETTPHMHALLVPLTQTKEVRRRGEGKATRKVERVEAWAYSSSRLLGGPAGLVRLHDELAKALKPMGVERGERGSKARHTDQRGWAAKLKAKEQDLEARENAATAREEALEAKVEEVNAWLDEYRPRISADLARDADRTKPRPSPRPGRADREKRGGQER
jgi:hypothetical protein